MFTYVVCNGCVIIVKHYIIASRDDEFPAYRECQTSREPAAPPISAQQAPPATARPMASDSVSEKKVEIQSTPG